MEAGGVCCGAERGRLGPVSPTGLGGRGLSRKSKGSESCEGLRTVPLQPDPDPAVTLSKGQHAPNLSVSLSATGAGRALSGPPRGAGGHGARSVGGEWRPRRRPGLRPAVARGLRVLGEAGPGQGGACGLMRTGHLARVKARLHQALRRGCGPRWVRGVCALEGGCEVTGPCGHQRACRHEGRDEGL